MEYKKILVTPKIAKTYLEANTRNRNVKWAVVTRYANDMKNGRWKKDTAQHIKISKTGEVMDGQHRLLAIIEAGLPIELDFAIGLDDAVFDVLDTGSSRHASDTFRIDGIKNANKIPSIIAFYHALMVSKTSGHLENKLTNSQLLEEYKKDPDHWQRVTRIATNFYIDFSKVLTPAFIGGFLAFFESCNFDNALDFMQELCTGMNIKNNSIALLRQKLISDKLAIRKMPKNHKIAIIIKTWNYYNTGKQVKIIHYNPKREKKPKAFCAN